MKTNITKFSLSRFWAEGLLFVLILYITGLHICFLKLYDRPVIDHEYHQTGHVAVEAYYLLKDNRISDWIKGLFTFKNSRQPRLIGNIMGLACYFLGLNRFVMRLVNLAFYLLLIIFTYLIGKKLWCKKVGLISTFILTSIPTIISYSRRGDLQFFETAMMLVSIYCLTLTKRFTHGGFSILFGLIFGLTLQTHETVLLYFLLLYVFIFIFDVYPAIRNKTEASKKPVLSNCILSFLIVILFFSSFYFKAFFSPNIAQGLRLYPQKGEGGYLTSYYTCLLYFLKALKNDLGLPIFSLFLICLLFWGINSYAKKRESKNSYYIFLFVYLIVFPFLIIALGNKKFAEFNTLEYIMPSYPLIALLIAMTLNSAKINWGYLLIFIANIGLWIKMSLNIFGSALNIFPQSIKYEQKENANLVLLRRHPLNASEVRRFFKDHFNGKKSLVFASDCMFDTTIPPPTRRYFDDLIMHSIIYPSAPGWASYPCYTDRNSDCSNSAIILFMYKDITGCQEIFIDGIKVFIGSFYLSQLKDVLTSYDFKMVKEFYVDGERILSIAEGSKKQSQ